LLHGPRLQPLRRGRAARGGRRRPLRFAARALRRSAARRRLLARPRRARAPGRAGRRGGAALMLTIALPKGRLQAPALERFAAAGLRPEEEPGSSRRLIVPALGGAAARFLVLKDGDVPLYVER